MLKDNSKVLFIGDSITDCSRNREDGFSMGNGFANMAAALFNARFPQKNILFLNRGIGGDRVDTLLERWDQDCLALEPDYVTLLVGVNSTNRRFKCDRVTTASEFEESYRGIVKKTLKNPEIELTIMEPFILPVEREDKRPAFITSMQIWEGMREDLNEKIHIIRKIAREYGIRFISLDGIFSELSVIKPCELWLRDGIHPTQAGHAVIAEQWLNKAVSL